MLHRGQVEALTNRANRNIWGTLVSYTPKDGTPIAVDANGDPLIGVFDSAHLVTLEDTDGSQTQDQAPMLELVLDDIDGLFDPAPGDKFTILTTGLPYTGNTYTVITPRYDSAQAVSLICVKGDKSP